MKQIRMGVFETNSSSTHSITLCSKEEYDNWLHDKVYLNEGSWCSLSKNKNKKFVTKDEAIEILTNSKYPPEKNLKEMDADELEEYFGENEIFTHSRYFDRSLEEFEAKYTTKGGEEIVAFGMYGYDN